jgi:hypothetical protein
MAPVHPPRAEAQRLGRILAGLLLRDPGQPLHRRSADETVCVTRHGRNSAFRLGARRSYQA